MAILPDFAAMLNNALASSASSVPSTGVRNAMVFTSRLRQRAAAIAPAQASLVGPLPPGAAGASSADLFFASIASRIAVQPRVSMAINPNMVKFKQPKRWTKKDTREGSVFFHFTNSRGQNNDVMTIEFNGNTGPIDRRGSLTTAGENASPGQPTGTAVPSADDTGAVAALMAWHNLYLLTQEPMLLPDNVENTFSITYISGLFPVSIEFIGFYNQVLEFEEDARKPNSRNYHFEFTVQRVNPRMDEVIDVVFGALQRATLDASSTGVILGPNARPVSP